MTKSIVSAVAAGFVIFAAGAASAQVVVQVAPGMSAEVLQHKIGHAAVLACREASTSSVAVIANDSCVQDTFAKAWRQVADIRTRQVLASANSPVVPGR